MKEERGGEREEEERSEDGAQREEVECPLITHAKTLGHNEQGDDEVRTEGDRKENRHGYCI